MNRSRIMKAFILLFIWTIFGCIETESESTSPGDGSMPAMTRGIRWVRNNPMFISGLTISMGSPPGQFVNEYFDAFHANAAHLWEDGLPDEVDGWADAGNPRFRFVSWVQTDGTSRVNGEVVGGYPANARGRIGYQVGDEPMSLGELYEYQKGFQAIRSHDPDALLILNFSTIPGDISQMLDYYGQSMDGDIISYDTYTWTNSTYQHLALFRRAALRYSKPYWRYLYAYLSESDDAFSESDLRWEAFIGLLYGYTGHTWFVYQVFENNVISPLLFNKANSFSASKTQYWSLIAQINKEMANLGRSVSQLVSTDVRYVPFTSYYKPPGTVAWSKGAGGDPYITDIAPAPGDDTLEILVGFFRDEFGEFYTMVQNVRHTHGDFPINGDDRGTIRVLFDFSKTSSGIDRSRILSLNKQTGSIDDVLLIKIGENSSYLDVNLAAGDPFFFKYATGAPFAMR